MSNINVMRKNLGPVTAYKYAVQQGYTGTEQEFAELMASYATVAQDVSAESRVAEGYALGKQNGVDVGDQSPYYHANAKYHAEQAAAKAQEAAESAAQAEGAIEVDDTLSVEGRAADAKVTGDRIDGIKSDLSDLIPESISVIESGYYAYNESSNTIASSQVANVNYKSKKMECSAGDIFTISGQSYGNAARMYVFADSSYNVLLVSAKDATLTNEKIIAPANTAYLFVNNYQNNVTLEKGTGVVSDISNLDTRLDAIETALYDAKPMSQIGVAFASQSVKANDGTWVYTLTQFISTIDYLPDYIKEIHVNTNRYFFRLYAYQQDGTYVGVWESGNGYKTAAIDLAKIKLTDAVLSDFGDYKFRITIGSSDYDEGTTMPTSDASKLTANVLKYDLPDDATVSPENYTGREISVFNKILCIGDSIIAGGANHPNITPDQSNASRTVPVSMYSIPTFLTKMYGVETTNWGISGATSRSWYNAKSEENWSGYDAAIIRIGNNDYTYSTSDSLTPAQCAELSAQYVSLIIDKLKADNAGIRIFLCTLSKANSTDRLAEYRVPMMNAFRDLAANDESVFLVDTNQYSNYEPVGGYYNGHPTAIGYQLMAQDIGNIISYIIHNNDADFKFIRWIGTEYAVEDIDDAGDDSEDVG